MSLKYLSNAASTIKKNLVLVDWQKKIGETHIAVAHHQSLIYFLIQGLGNEQDRKITIRLNQGSALVVYGIVIGSGKEKLLADLNIIHAAPDTESRVIIKGIFTGESSGKVNGTIFIDKKGQKSNAYLEERMLLLSDTARAETKPNLEILANDVKASHAATVSRISEEELFYLASRGIEQDAAAQMIINAFLASQLTALPDTKLHGKIMSEIDKILIQ